MIYYVYFFVLILFLLSFQFVSHSCGINTENLVMYIFVVPVCYDVMRNKPSELYFLRYNTM
jgi:hypothetical protein